MAEFGEFVAAGHLSGEFVEGDFAAFLVEDGLAEFEDDEVVADEVGVVGVVGDEHHAEAGVAGGGGVFEHHAGLLDAEGGGGLVEDQDPGAEVDGAGDRHALALATGEGADGLVDVLDHDAHLAEFLIGDLLHLLGLESGQRELAAGQLRAEEEVPPHLHQADHGEVLVDGGDAVAEGLPR